MAGVALDDIDCWQAWHLWHWVGSGGALGQPWRRDAAAFCVAGVALRDICLHFVWQAWHFVTSTFDPPSLCVARAAIDDINGAGGALGSQQSSWPRFLRGRCGTWRHVAALCVAGVAL